MIVNAHTHVYSGLAGERFGVTPVPSDANDGFPFESGSFAAALRSLWWNLDRALDEEILRAAARLYVAEARLAGTDVLIDHHESPNFIEGSLDVIADACQDLGMSALLCYGASERNGGPAEARRGLDECRRLIRNNRRPLVRGAVGLHAAFTVCDATIHAAGRLSRELAVPVHVHCAEDGVDRAGFGRLIKFEALGEGSILAHGVHLDEEDVRIAAFIGCWIVQNPRSNEANGVGYPAALRASNRVALGTDGFPSRMSDEVQALSDRETPKVIAERLAGGEMLARELRLPGSTAVDFDIDAIRAEGAMAAEKLREKMHEKHGSVGSRRR